MKFSGKTILREVGLSVLSTVVAAGILYGFKKYTDRKKVANGN